MHTTDNRPLGSLTDDAYETLCDTIDPAAGLPTDDAHDRLREAGFADGDITYAITRLLDRGYLYEIENRLFVTIPED